MTLASAFRPVRLSALPKCSLVTSLNLGVLDQFVFRLAWWLMRPPVGGVFEPFSHSSPSSCWLFLELRSSLCSGVPSGSSSDSRGISSSSSSSGCRGSANSSRGSREPGRRASSRSRPSSVVESGTLQEALQSECAAYWSWRVSTAAHWNQQCLPDLSLGYHKFMIKG